MNRLDRRGVPKTHDSEGEPLPEIDLAAVEFPEGQLVVLCSGTEDYWGIEGTVRVVKTFNATEQIKRYLAETEDSPEYGWERRLYRWLMKEGFITNAGAAVGVFNPQVLPFDE